MFNRLSIDLKRLHSVSKYKTLDRESMSNDMKQFCPIVFHFRLNIVVTNIQRQYR